MRKGTDFQRRVAAISDKNPKDVTGQIYELAANGRFVGLEFFAYDDKASLGFQFQSLKRNLVTR
jgi:hypothetical protein